MIDFNDIEVIKNVSRIEDVNTYWIAFNPEAVDTLLRAQLFLGIIIGLGVLIVCIFMIYVKKYVHGNIT